MSLTDFREFAMDDEREGPPPVGWPVFGRTPLLPLLSGITPRDYFAAHALIGIIASHAHPSAPGKPDPTEAATAAYEYADSMLIERARRL